MCHRDTVHFERSDCDCRHFVCGLRHNDRLPGGCSLDYIYLRNQCNLHPCGLSSSNGQESSASTWFTTFATAWLATTTSSRPSAAASFWPNSHCTPDVSFQVRRGRYHFCLLVFEHPDSYQGRYCHRHVACEDSMLHHISNTRAKPLTSQITTVIVQTAQATVTSTYTTTSFTSTYSATQYYTSTFSVLPQPTSTLTPHRTQVRCSESTAVWISLDKISRTSTVTRAARQHLRHIPSARASPAASTLVRITMLII